MHNNIYITAEEARQLAYSYFDGTISDDDEQRLTAYITHTPGATAQLHAWEQEWLSAYTPSPVTEAAYQQMASRISATATRRRRLHTWRIAAIVACAASLIAFVFGIGTYIGRLTAPEQYFTCSAPYGSTATTLLPDGSRVTLNAGSTLRYSSRFSTNDRRVELQGEGYFDVARRDGARFTVHTDGYDVEVRGTRFYVSAYPTDNYVTTTLLKGSVAIAYGDSCYVLKPGERATLNRLTHQMQCSHAVKTSSGWKQGNIDCDDISLGELRPIIERRYNVSIHIADSSLAARRLYISLVNNETIDEVMAALKRTLDVKVQRNGHNIVIEP